jgi:hypothetical protein
MRLTRGRGVALQGHGREAVEGTAVLTGTALPKLHTLRAKHRIGQALIVNDRRWSQVLEAATTKLQGVSG